MHKNAAQNPLAALKFCITGRGFYMGQFDIEDVFNKRFNQLLKSQTIADIADASGLARTTLAKYRDGETSPSLRRVRAIEQAAGKPPGWLLGLEGGVAPIIRLVESLDEIENAGEEPGKSLLGSLLKDDDQELFAIKMRSDTMEPTIKQGDYVVFRVPEVELTPKPGQIYCMRIGNGTTIGRPMDTGKAYTIVYDNDAYPRVESPKDKVGMFAKVVFSVREL